LLLRLAISQMLFFAIFQFSNLFINTYFFRLHQDARIVAQYNFWVFLAWGICFYFGFQLCARNTRIGVAIAGLSCLAAMSALLLGVQSTFWLGLFIGTSGGFFWTSYLSIYRTLGKQSEGTATFARVSSLSYAVTIFIPMLFGHLVEGKGYIVGFIVLLVLSLLLAAMSMMLPSFRTKKIVLRRASFSHPGFLASNMLQGTYFSFIGIAAGLLVFMSGQGEASVGTFATFYATVTLAVNIIMAYLLPQRYNSLFLLLSTVIYILSSFLFLSDWDNRVIVFNFLMAGAGPLFASTYMGLQFAYINQSYKNGEEGLFIREFALSIGRLSFFGYMWFFGIDVSSLWFYIFLFTASAFPFLVYIIMRNWGKDKPEVPLIQQRPQVSS
jgi:hypothetical protein